ncbi:hypothetical protein NU688_28920 [Variovorax sp. ZS18.2.2]|uniref:hypothetical protein n=1 Tax=Variovorax sp. ZS18.2.2 TaxID=2971255 RepID=UPI0021518F5D|nr:hypothetical protein [Variovorax sp. ZS18.2.2]MCR6480211.1 hypothetical protein [Variovorax sp. ZS18.2.2]
MHSKTQTPALTVERVLRLSIVARALFASTLLASVGMAHAAFSSGSTGADGELNPAVSTEIVLPPSGILNYKSINIPKDVIVTFKKNALNTPVQLLASGDVTVTGTIDIRGGSGKATGTAGDGNQADDGLPGLGGPGGFDGGRGGREDAKSQPEVIRGGAGLGPGGGIGGYERAEGTCFGGAYYHRYGGGGAFAGAGGSRGQGSCASTSVDQRFEVAKAYGSAALVPLIGGSGGGGGKGNTIYPGSGGGGGGGAILIAASGTLTITGTINASGGHGGDLVVPSGVDDSDGGGGSGGAIKLVATAIKGAGTLVATGGCWNNNGDTGYYYCTADYPAGSAGRIRLEGDSITYTGASTPIYTSDVPGPITVAKPPSIRIASVGGTKVPAAPTGNADVALPATTTDDVAVDFETVNVPTGNTIRLRVVPAYGIAVETLSPAITGTAASGKTSVKVKLPQGPSVLQAITSYTVTVAQAESLSRFAENEKVERVELVASMGQESTAQLITASGKRYTVPASVLQLVGLAG